MDIRGWFHSHEEAIHRDDGPSGLIFTLLFCDMKMGATSSDHAVHAPVSKWHVCRFMFLSFPLSRLVSGSCSHSPIWRCQLLFAVNLVSFPLQLHSILLLHSILHFRFQSSHLCTMLPALQACRKRLDHSLSLPAENRTCFIEANPHVHRVHTVAHGPA